VKLKPATWRALLVLIALSQIGLAAWMAISPSSFFDTIAGFGARNDHYIRDAATFPFAIGVGLLAAAWRPAWRVPVLSVAAVWYCVHAVNHLIDINKADPSSVGPLDFASLLLTGLALAYLAYLAAKADLTAKGER
jgi:predicted anti-sigma-YlaC factor YlaD